MEKRKSITNTFFLNSFLLILLMAALLGFAWIVIDKLFRLPVEMDNLRQEEVSRLKSRIKSEVLGNVRFMEQRSVQLRAELEKSLAEFVNSADATATLIYNENKSSRSESEIKKMIKDSLCFWRMNDGSSNIFIDSADGTVVLYPPDPIQEGRMDSLYAASPENLKKMQSRLSEIASAGSGYIEIALPYTHPPRIRLVYLRYFAPYKWFIGSSASNSINRKRLQNELITRISGIRFASNGYFFVLRPDDDRIVWHPEKNLIGRKLADLSPDIDRLLIGSLNDSTRSAEGHFEEYSWPLLKGTQKLNKISFTKFLPEWNWVIGAGFYESDIDNMISAKKVLIRNDMISDAMLIVGIIILVSCITIIISFYHSRRIRKSIDLFIDFFRRFISESRKIDTSGIVFSEFAILAAEANKMLEKRMQIEHKLNLYRDIFANSTDAISVIDTRGYFVDQNRSNQILCGLTLDELKNKTPAAFVGEKTYTFIMKELFINGSVSTEIVFGMEGEMKCVLFRGFTIKDSHGNPLYYIGLCNDVTEARKKEEQIKELNRQIVFILNATKTGLNIVDNNMNLVYVDPDTQKRLGEYHDKKCYEYFEVHQEKCPDCYIHSFDTPGKISISERYNRESARTMQITEIPYQNEQGQCFVAQLTVDITEKKKSESEIRDYIAYQGVSVDIRSAAHDVSENELFEIFLQSLVCNYDFRLAWFAGIENDKITPLSKASYIESSLDSLLTQDAEQLISELINTRKYVLCHNLKDESSRWPELVLNPDLVSLLVLPFFMNGSLTGAFVLYSSLESAFCESRLSKLNDLVDDFALIIKDHRKNSEAEKALRDAIIELQSANNAKAEFLSNLNYEIRTPINGINTALELLSDSELGLEQSEYLEIMKLSAASLKNILSEMFESDAVENCKLTFKPEPFDLYSVIDSVIKNISKTCRQKELSLKFSSDPRIPNFISGDKMKFAKVLEILMENAAKFTEDGLIYLAVECLEKDEKSCLLRFKIQDTGIGLSEEKQHRLSKFLNSPADARLEAPEEAVTGMGLALAKKYLDIMGGRIEVESTASAGSLFYFELSFDIFDASAAAAAAAEDINSGVSTKTNTIRKSLRILLAEDNIISQKLTTKILEKKGHKVTIAPNGKVVLDIIARGEIFDIIIMDLQMPEMDGYEVAAVIREQEKASGRHIPIIALTAFVSREGREKCVLSGMDDFMSKPFNVKSLMERIYRLTGSVPLK